MRQLRSILVALAAVPSAAAQTIWSPSVDSSVLSPGNSVACQSGGVSADNGFWRSYDPVAYGYGQGEDFEITHVVFGIENAQAGSGVGIQTVHVRVYYNGSGGPPDPALSILLGAETLMLPDQALSFETVAFPVPILVCNGGGTIDVEIDVPDAFASGAGDAFVIGSNALGESAPGFFRSTACGIPNPLPLSALGFPDMHMAIDLVVRDGERPIGTNYCPSEPNSSGRTAGIRATGNPIAAVNDVTLAVCGLPANQFGYFISNTIPGFIPHPAGSSGNFCLGGGAFLGRFDGTVLNSGVFGTFSMALDVGAIPIAVLPGMIAAGPGDSFYFQCWYRDVGGTDNFTDGIRVDFE